MKTDDVDILIVPDRGGAPSDHWQSRWVRNLRTARRLEQTDWLGWPEEWGGALVAAATSQTRPAVLVAHGVGVLAVAHAAEQLAATTIVGAFLVAPVDPQHLSALATAGGLPAARPMPATRLPWPALVVASSDDPTCTLDAARALAAGWGAGLTEAGAVGHLDLVSGHGPWPEGLLRFGQFLRELG